MATSDPISICVCEIESVRDRRKIDVKNRIQFSVYNNFAGVDLNTLNWNFHNLAMKRSQTWIPFALCSVNNLINCCCSSCTTHYIHCECLSKTVSRLQCIRAAMWGYVNTSVCGARRQTLFFLQFAYRIFSSLCGYRFPLRVNSCYRCFCVVGRMLSADWPVLFCSSIHRYHFNIYFKNILSKCLN